MKESNQIKFIEYVKSQKIDYEPEFKWWVNFTLKKRETIISAVNKSHHKKTHKFVIWIPRNAQEAHSIERENGNTLWDDVMAKNMRNTRVAFHMMKSGESAPNGYQIIRCHGILDVKIDSFKRNFRLVAGGHMTEALVSIKYKSVVSRNRVQIALTIAALHDL